MKITRSSANNELLNGGFISFITLLIARLNTAIKIIMQNHPAYFFTLYVKIFGYVDDLLVPSFSDVSRASC